MNEEELDLFYAAVKIFAHKDITLECAVQDARKIRDEVLRLEREI